MNLSIRTSFQERVVEVNAYLDLIVQMEAHIAESNNQQSPNTIAFTTAQQRIMYSHFYLHLYSLVESTIVGCLDCVADSIIVHDGTSFEQMDAKIRNEWIKSYRKANWDGANARFTTLAADFCEAMVNNTPLGKWSIQIDEQNWDNLLIEKTWGKVGINHDIYGELKTKIERHVKDDQGVLVTIKKYRNQLAHGEVSFEQLGMDITSSTLHRYLDITVEYLEFVVESTERYLSDRLYLAPAFR